MSARKFKIDRNKITEICDNDKYSGEEISFCPNVKLMCDICLCEKSTDFYQIKFREKIETSHIPLYPICTDCFAHIFEGLLFHNHFNITLTIKDNIKIAKSKKYYDNGIMHFNVFRRKLNSCSVCDNDKSVKCNFMWKYISAPGSLRTKLSNASGAYSCSYCIDCLLKITNRKLYKTTIDFKHSHQSTAIKIKLVPNIWSPLEHKLFPQNVRQIVTMFMIYLKKLKSNYNIMIDKHIAFGIFRMVF